MAERVKLDSPDAFAAAIARRAMVLRLHEEQTKKRVKCVSCGFPLDEWGNDFEDFHPEMGYAYCHSYCCFCCPDTNKKFCDKEILEGEHINSTIPWSRRKEYV